MFYLQSQFTLPSSSCNVTSVSSYNGNLLMSLHEPRDSPDAGDKMILFCSQNEHKSPNPVCVVWPYKILDLLLSLDSVYVMSRNQ